MGNKKKYRDINGFLHLEGTPISRVQVAPYLGKQIDSKGKMDIDPKLKPNELYGVLRPADELFDEDTMRSFDGMPFRVGHQMLGKQDEGANAMLKSVDSNPVDGCLFNVRQDPDRPDYLIADIVIYTEKALRAIANGTKELSLGYRCFYVPVDSYPEPEFYKGTPYLFKQAGITANHLALVPRGRAGSTVCVQDEAVVTVDGLVITCDSLPEEIELMEDKEKTAKDKLCELLKGSEEQIQDCLDYCAFTEEQKAKVKEMKKDGTTDKEVVAVKEKTEDACPHCNQSVAKDAQPPTPPPEKEEGVTPVEKVDPKKPKEEPAPAAPAPAEGAPAAPAPAPAEPVPAEGAPAAPAPAEPAKAEPAKDSKPKEKTEDCGGKKVKTYTQDEFDEGCKKAKEEGIAEVKETLKDKIYTQDDMDEACKKAEAKGRKDGIRAKLLADAVGEDADDKTEADVARAACKKIKGLEFAADAADEVALAAIKGHLTSLKNKKPETNDEPKKPVKKTLLSVPTQDEAIAKTSGSFNAGMFQEFLASH